MIIVNVKLGLGNQLFQYAFGRSLAHHWDDRVKFDCSWFDTPDANKTFGLSYFDIDPEIASEEDIASVVRFGGYGRRLAERLSIRFPTLAASWFNFLRERPQDFLVFGRTVPRNWEYTPSVFDLSGHMYFDGYWQSARYFRNASDELSDNLRVSTSIAGENQVVRDEIQSRTAVSVHVRRGDYVRLDSALPISYYDKAFQYMEDRFDDITYYVFSDDIDWAREHLQSERPMRFVSHNGPEEAHEDLRLMYESTHNIISNSTFSWWGAWLNRNDDKQVIAPSRWFRWHHTRNLDIIPSTWTTIGIE